MNKYIDAKDYRIIKICGWIEVSIGFLGTIVFILGMGLSLWGLGKIFFTKMIDSAAIKDCHLNILIGLYIILLTFPFVGFFVCGIGVLKHLNWARIVSLGIVSIFGGLFIILYLWLTAISINDGSIIAALGYLFLDIIAIIVVSAKVYYFTRPHIVNIFKIKS